MKDGLKNGLLLAYYGDDFTGSTDVMEVMAAAGLSSVLFLNKLQPELLSRFNNLRCIGIAGTSRSRSPAWMDANLPAAFSSLASLQAPILQYKVCSTFDSSPAIGSIGKAIEIGMKVVNSDGASCWSPTIVAAPRLKRYQAFGNLFAAVNGQGYRLDRHPTMSCHPVTPMHEADLRLHLAEQTERPIALIDFTQLMSKQAVVRLRVLQTNEAPVVLVDVLDDETLRLAGELVWENLPQARCLFSASSSGLPYALTAYWRAQAWVPATTQLVPAKPVSVIAGVSGSCSPVTARQIAWARAHGFGTFRLQVSALLKADEREIEIQRVLLLAAESLRSNQSVVVFTAEGPDDASVRNFENICKTTGIEVFDGTRLIGESLGRVMKLLKSVIPLNRIAIAGGDSSGEVMNALGIDALTVLAQMVPGAPLCRAWSVDSRIDGLELVLKGGQMGEEDFFGVALGASTIMHSTI